MKKEKFYIVLIVLLVVINVVQVGAKFVFHKPPPMVAGMNFKYEAPRLLGLNDLQTQDFFVLVSSHRDQIIKLQKQQHEKTLSYINNPSILILDEIADLQKQKIILTENHFNDIFKILSDKQKVNFPKFKQAAFKIING